MRLLKNRPHEIGAEVGVFRGDTSAGLLAALPDLRLLICVDPWVEDEDFKRHCPNKRGAVFNANWTRVRAQFMARMEPVKDRVRAMQMTSMEAAPLIGDRTLDFVFLDGNHGYEWVRQDAKVWWPKVKIGGLMIGDDYRNKPTYGVIKAVNELFNGAHRHIGRTWWIPKTTKEAI